MAFVLRRDTKVARDTGSGPEFAVLPKGTRLDHVAEPELAQLAPAHFIDEDGHGRTPPDWRPQERQDADAEFLQQQADETAARLAAKAERLAVTGRTNQEARG